MSTNAERSNDQPAVDKAEMTIDEVARDAEIPVSTVRMYQNKGLLHPPEKRGRVGYYGPNHRDRLRLIAHLQDRGFSLAAIKDSLDSWQQGRSLNHLLGVGDIAPEMERESVDLSAADMAEHFAGIELTQGDLQRAASLGLLELNGSGVTVSNRALLGVGPEVARLGVPLARILDEYEALHGSVAQIAERFRQVFDENMWQPFVERGMPAEEIGEITSSAAKLTELATAVITAELHQRFAEFTESYVESATNSSAQPR